MPALGLVVAVGVVCLVTIVGAFRTRGTAAGERTAAGWKPCEPSARFALLRTGALGLLGLLLTLPSAPPFSGGMHLGMGFALGIAVAILGLCLIARSRGDGELYAAAGLVGLVTLALLVVALIMPGYADDGIIGVALGVVVGWLAANGQGTAAGWRARGPWGEWFVTVAVGLCGGQYLAVHHFAASGLVAQLIALTASAALMLGLVFAACLRASDALETVTVGGALVATMVLAQIGAAVMAGIGRNAGLSVHLGGLGQTYWPLVVGAGCSALLLAVLRDAGVAARSRVTTVMLAAGLVVVLLALGYRHLAGWGLAVALLPLAAAAALGRSRLEAAPTGSASTTALLRALQLGVLVVLWRVLLVRAGVEEHPETDQFYVIIGLLAGMGIPWVVAEWARGRAARLLAAGALAPAVLFVLWDLKALLGMSWGLVAGAFFVLWTELGGSRLEAAPTDDEEMTGATNRGPAEAPLVALLMALVGVQFLPLLAPLTDLGRRGKIGLIVGGFVVVLLAAIIERLVWGVRTGKGGGADAA